LSRSFNPCSAAYATIVHGLIQREALVTSQAKGTFDVKVQPLPNDEKVAGVTVGRMSIDKQLAGDIEGTSKGEMITAGTSVQGSAGYVAVEHMTITLKGRSGSCKLLHMGTMKRGNDFNLMITVIPDSGTDQLVGLAGKMTIIVADGKHSYEFDYTLPDLP
jgi:Protein of unknown function (DUF3224)